MCQHIVARCVYSYILYVNLDLILLGLLREPASGYDLGRYFAGSLRHFWTTDLPQLYRTLNRLEREGLLEVRLEASSRGPRRRVYRTTDEGLARLKTALASSPMVAPVRDPLLARIHLLGALDDGPAALAVLHEMRSVLAAELDERRSAAPARLLPGGPSGEPASLDEFFEDLAGDAAFARATAMLSWATRSIHRMEERLRRAH